MAEWQTDDIAGISNVFETRIVNFHPTMSALQRNYRVV